MVALYDYNPEVQSPQDNPDSELPFKKGQVLTVVGEMVSGNYSRKTPLHISYQMGYCIVLLYILTSYAVKI